MTWLLLSLTMLQLCMMAQVQHNLQIGICSNARELETCQREVEKKQQELLYARTTTVNISRVDIDIGSSWQYTNSTFSPSVTVVKVENHLGVGCTTCTEMLKELQKALDHFIELNGTDDTTNIQHCHAQLQNCKSTLTELTEELLYVRNASIFLQNITVEMGRTWQYRQSVVNQSYTMVEVVNKGNACSKCAEGMAKLLAKMQMAVDQLPPTTNKTSTPAFQYLPTSCRDVSNFNPDSPSGYYWLRNKDSNLVQLHCLFGEPTESNPAVSCKQIEENFPTSQSSYYWLRSPDGTPVQAYCDMGRRCKSSV